MTPKHNLRDFFRDYLSNVPVSLVRFISTIYRQRLLHLKLKRLITPCQGRFISSELMSLLSVIKTGGRGGGGGGGYVP